MVSRDSEIGSDKAYIDTDALNIVSYAIVEEKDGLILCWVKYRI